MIQDTKDGTRRGFVLLLVLVTLLVATTALTGTARQILELRRGVLREKETIQARWGMASCQKSVLPYAQGMFDEMQRTAKRGRGSKNLFPSQVRSRIVLGDQIIELVLSDENAKANINTLSTVSGGQTAGTIAKLVPVEAARSLSIDARAAGTSMSIRRGNSKEIAKALTDDRGYAYTSWGEVFDVPRLQNSLGNLNWPELTSSLSLFGDGRLNPFRAQDETVLEVCNTVTTDGLSRRVLDRVRETSLRDMSMILEQVVTNKEDRQALDLLLTEQSTCFSLWISSRGRVQEHRKWSVRFVDATGRIEVLELLVP
jgi:hypothetical protein